MKAWKRFAVSGSAMAASMAIATTVAMAGPTGSTSGFTSKVSNDPVQNSTVYITVPNLDNTLQAASSLQFTFTVGKPSQQMATSPAPVTETGTLVTGAAASQYPPDTYAVPLPNFGSPSTDVYASTTYSFSGYDYTMSAGPLTDTLPEVPLAALLPAALAGVWFFKRKRKTAVGVQA